MFADRAKIIIKSGRGGDGHVSFRREKYVPNGGPDGGDGGDGGSVIFEIDNGAHTLSEYRHRRKFAATNGDEGGKNRKHGKNGKDIVLKVPPGTVIKEAETGQVIADMSGDNRHVTVLKGGRGGNGNQHYATSTMQAPKYAQPGMDGIELEVQLELKCIADVGLVGFPNAGKSTFISRVTNAKPEIASYPFTTLSPHLGVVELGENSFVIADIPGLIEGASEGVGLGHEFLRHIERTRALIHIVDAAGTEGRDPVDDIYKINEELTKYGVGLIEKKQIIAANKLDAIQTGDGEEDILARIKREFEPKGFEVYPISAVTGEGVKELISHVAKVLKAVPKPSNYEQEYFPEEHREEQLPFTVEYDPGLKMYLLEGPRIEKMLGYTNLESEKGFLFFQNFIKDIGAIEQLKELGMVEGDTVKIYGHQFEYYE